MDLDVSSDFIVTGSDDKTVGIFDARSGNLIRRLEGHIQGVTSVAVTSDQKYIVSGSFDNYVFLWSFEEKLKQMGGHSDIVDAIIVSPDDAYAVSGGRDKLIKVFSIERRVEICGLEGHKAAVKCLAMTRDGLYLASGDA